jgi:hypothetical protein
MMENIWSRQASSRIILHHLRLIKIKIGNRCTKREPFIDFSDAFSGYQAQLISINAISSLLMREAR